MISADIRRIAAVLDEVITDFGRRAADDPRRLRGLITDTLGAEATGLGDAIDAFVVSAEAGVPRALLSDAGRESREDLVERLATRLDDGAVAGEIVDGWMSALRVQDGVSTDPGEAVAVGLPTFPPGEAATKLPPEASDEVLSGLPTSSVSPATKPRWAILPSDPETRRRGALVLGVVGLLMLLAGVGFAMSRNGETVAVDTTSTTAAENTTTTPETTTTTTLPPLTSIEPDVEEKTWGATVSRQWTLEDDAITMKIAVESGDEAARGSVWELFPESLEFDATTLVARWEEELFDSFESEVVDRIFNRDDVVRLILDMEPNTTWWLEYSVPLPPAAEDDPRYLETLLAEWEAMMETFLATPAPDLEVTTEGPDSDQLVIYGTTTPGAEVRVDGEDVEVSEAGEFSHIFILQPGENAILVRAFDWIRGKSTDFEIAEVFDPPTVEVTTPPTQPPSTPQPTQPPSTTQPTQPPSTTQPTQPPSTTQPTQPPNQPPTVTCSTSQTGNLNFYAENYTIWINKANCFSDPEGDNFTLHASTPPDTTLATYSGSSPCQGGAGACWTLYPYSGWDGSCLVTSHQIWARDSHGNESQRINVTWRLNC